MARAMFISCVSRSLYLFIYLFSFLVRGLLAYLFQAVGIIINIRRRERGKRKKRVFNNSFSMKYGIKLISRPFVASKSIRTLGQSRGCDKRKFPWVNFGYGMKKKKNWPESKFIEIDQLNLIRKRPGIFVGQCSEICGTNHRFIPIIEWINFIPIFFKLSK